MKGKRELAQLLDEARRDGEEAFSQLVTRFQGLVMKISLTMLGSQHEAQDAAQEVFLRFFRNLQAMDATRGVSAWFHKTTVRVCLNLLERRKRILLNEQPGQPDQHPARSIPASLLPGAFAVLTARERAAFVLVHLFGYSVAETGQTLRVAPGTVKSLCFRARNKMREHMEKEGQ